MRIGEFAAGVIVAALLSRWTPKGNEHLVVARATAEGVDSTAVATETPGSVVD